MKKTHIVLEKEGGVADFQWKAKDGGWSMVVDGCPVETSSRLQSKDNKWKPLHYQQASVLQSEWVGVVSGQ